MRVSSVFREAPASWAEVNFAKGWTRIQRCARQNVDCRGHFGETQFRVRGESVQLGSPKRSKSKRPRNAFFLFLKYRKLFPNEPETGPADVECTPEIRTRAWAPPIFPIHLA